MTDHTRTENIGGNSILFLVVLRVVAENRYDIRFIPKATKFEMVEMRGCQLHKDMQGGGCPSRGGGWSKEGLHAIAKSCRWWRWSQWKRNRGEGDEGEEGRGSW